VDQDEKKARIETMPERHFVGELKSDQDKISVSFFAGSSPDGEIGIRFEPFPRTTEALAMEQRWSKPSVKPALYTLTGSSKDGAQFESTEVLFKSFGYKWTTDTGHVYLPSPLYQRCSFRVPLAEPSKHPVVRLLVKGFESFEALSAACPLGQVFMSGASQLDDPDRITGLIEIRADNIPDDVKAWIAAAEKLAWHIRSIMSFAAGVTLLTPLTEVIDGAVVIVLCRSQVRQIRSTMRNFDKLNLRPIFEAAVQSHFNPAIAMDGISMAIEWMTQESTHHEVRLFSAMTALEHLINIHLCKDDKQIMTKGKFAKLRKQLCTTLTGMRDQENETALDEIETKLAELNRRSLRRKLNILLRTWAVPLEGIDGTRMNDAIEARNQVFHTGSHQGQDLWPHVSVIRELMVRIILTALRFEGQYATYLDGARYEQFPPAPNATL
jgi:hypothetical protein